MMIIIIVLHIDMCFVSYDLPLPDKNVVAMHSCLDGMLAKTLYASFD